MNNASIRGARLIMVQNSSVSAVSEAERYDRLAVRNQEADGRHDVIDRSRSHGQMSNAKFLAGNKRHVLHHWPALVFEDVESRIDIVVEYISLEQIDYFLGCVNADWLFNFREKIVHVNRQAGDMIHVRMRDDHVAHLAALRVRQSDPDAAGVNGDAFVD